MILSDKLSDELAKACGHSPTRWRDSGVHPGRDGLHSLCIHSFSLVFLYPYIDFSWGEQARFGRRSLGLVAAHPTPKFRSERGALGGCACTLLVAGARRGGVVVVLPECCQCVEVRKMPLVPCMAAMIGQSDDFCMIEKCIFLHKKTGF